MARSIALGESFRRCESVENIVDLSLAERIELGIQQGNDACERRCRGGGAGNGREFNVALRIGDT